MNIANIILCTAVMQILCTLESDGCTWHVSKDNISKSWQSSSYEYSNGTVLCGLGIGTATFFHTAVGSSTADLGYHWFAMKLREPVVIHTVLIRIRGLNGTMETLHSRAEGIEVWTSAMAQDFGSESCSSRSIGSGFTATQNAWKLCGITQQQGLTDLMKATCAQMQMVLMLLLKNSVAETNITVKQCMSFAGIILIGANVTAEIQPSQLVMQNSTAALKCNAHDCRHTFTNLNAQIKLCHVNSNSCLASGILTNHIASVQPAHSGTYTCSVGDEVLSSINLNVLYPPSRMKISVFESNCSAESTQGSFALETSSAEPLPQHLCTAFDLSSNNSMLLRQIEYESTFSDRNALKSHWVCQNCSMTGDLRVQCSAVQLCGSQETSLLCSSPDRVMWETSNEMKIEWNCSIRDPRHNRSRYFIVLAIVVCIFAILICAAVAIGTNSWIRAQRAKATTCDQRRANATAVNCEMTSSHAQSEATVYLEILADGD